MSPDKKQNFSWTQYGEARTGNGQVVQFSAIPDQIQQVKEALSNVKDMHFPESHKVNVAHGGYGMYSRYEIQQHKYAGGNSEDGHGGYIEVLEIKNAPEGHHGIVIHEFDTRKGGTFCEFATLDTALAFFKRGWHSINLDDEKLPQSEGFIRRVKCGALTPWFYAIGNQELVGDYALPEDVQDDPVYKIGQKFVVTGEDGTQKIKTCMGTRFLDYEEEEMFSYHPRRRRVVKRIVYWDDGSSWNEHFDSDSKAVPLVEDQMWITEANQQFQALLSGKIKEFTINFADGRKFVGKVVLTKEDRQSPAGKYYAEISLESGETLQGAFDFKPSEKFPTVQSFVKGKLKTKSPIAKMIIKAQEADKNGKKWKGVFHNPSEK